MATTNESSPLLKNRTNTIFERSVQSNIFPYNEPELFSRWQSFCSVCLYVSVAGTTYAFAIYSQLLKNNLGYSQSSLDLIASIGTTGLYLSLLAGLAIEKFGFRAVVQSGGLFIFIGFMYIYLAIWEKVPSDIYSISFFYFLSQAGVCCHITSAVTVAVKLFPPQSRGIAIGLTKGYFGLSTAVLGDLAGGYFEKIPSLFLVFIALFIPIIGFIGSSAANILPPHLVSFDYEQDRGMSTSMQPVVIHWCVLFVSLLTLGYVQYMYSLSDWAVSLFTAMLLLVVFSIQLLPSLYGDRVLPAEDCAEVLVSDLDTTSDKRGSNGSEYRGDDARRRGRSIKSYRQSIDDSSDSSGSDFLVDEELASTDEQLSSSQVAIARRDESERQSEVADAATICFYGESLSLSESVMTWRMWVLFFSFMVTCGGGLMVIYNVNAIAQAADLSPSSFFVTLISLANGLGRVVAGLSSDHVVKATRISKLQLLCLVALLMSLTQALLSVGSPWLLFPCFLGVGFLFGCNVSLTAVNVADVFGAKYIATNFGLVDTSPIIGSYVFATFSIAVFYKDNTVLSTGESTCLGASCFRYSFMLNSLACLAAGCALLVMHLRTPRDTVAVGSR